MIAAQASREERLAIADDVIDNDGDARIARATPVESCTSSTCSLEQHATCGQDRYMQCLKTPDCGQGAEYAHGERPPYAP